MRSVMIKPLLLVTAASFMLFGYGFIVGEMDVLQPQASNIQIQTAFFVFTRQDMMS